MLWNTRKEDCIGFAHAEKVSTSRVETNPRAQEGLLLFDRFWSDLRASERVVQEFKPVPVEAKVLTCADDVESKR